MKTPEEYEKEITKLKAGLAYREGQLEDMMREFEHQDTKNVIPSTADEVIQYLEKSLTELNQANVILDKMTSLDWQRKHHNIMNLIGKIKTQVIRFQGFFYT